MYFQNAEQQIDVNPKTILTKIDSWVDGFIKLLPNIGVALVVIILFYGLGRLGKYLVKKAADTRKRTNLGNLLGDLVKWIIFVTGFLLALTIVTPSIKPGDLIAGLGVSSVAIGFAFKDILQNWLAGLLLLLRQPFEIGDQIIVNNIEGTVRQIQTRSTIIREYSGERVVIPNSEIYTNAVKVKTANEPIRSQYDVGIGYADDIDEAKQVIKEALQEVDIIDKSKDIEVLPWELAASWVTLRVRWWTDSPRATVVEGRAKVIIAIKKALDKAKIDMPYETQVHLFHDQTESSDGNRSTQREGWPDDGDSNRVPARVEKIKLKAKHLTSNSSDKE